MFADIEFDHAALARLVENAADAIVIVDATGAIRFANAAVLDVFGYEPSELLGESYSLLIPEDLHEVHEGHHHRFMQQPMARPMGTGLTLRARHRAGYDFDVAIALAPVGGEEPLVAASVREMTTVQRLIRRLAATNDILTASLAGEDQRAVEERAATLTCRLVDGSTAWLLLRAAHDDPLEVVAECGDGTNRPVIERLLAAGLGDRVDAPVIIDGGEVTVGSGDIVEMVAAPVRSRSIDGVLVAARFAGSARFEPADGEVVHEFASAIAITLELIAANDQLEQLRSMAEHDRIARDLHDTVIQRLFAVAMRLESAVAESQGVAAERMAEAVEGLDEVIREIRSTIFHLRRPHDADRGLRSVVAAEVDRVADLLGFAPSLRVVGPIDAPVDEETAREVAAVVRELLSNVARHADAAGVDVAVRVDDGSMSVVVEDDGVGLPDTPGRGTGIANLMSRARVRGGTFTVVPNTPRGVRAEWSVPVADE